MIIGHFGPALVAHSTESDQERRAPIWYYYAASQMPDVALYTVAAFASGDPAELADPTETPMTSSTTWYRSSGSSSSLP